jgi:hypothetical protein
MILDGFANYHRQRTERACQMSFANPLAFFDHALWENYGFLTIEYQRLINCDAHHI